MLQVATTVHKEGYCSLSEAFSIVSPDVNYTAQHARSRLLQMPLACLRVDFKPGVSQCFLVEHHPSLNYQNLIALLKTIVERQQPKSVPPLDKVTVKSLLGLCQSDKERECVRYAVFRASGVSATQARKHFGFENMLERSRKVEACIDHAKYIRKAVDELARSKEKSVLMSLGIQSDPSDSSSGSADESTDEDDYYSGLDRNQSQVCSLHWEDLSLKLCEIVVQSEFNWFEVVARVEALVGLDDSDAVMTQLSSSIDKLRIGKKEKRMLEISREALLVEEEFNSFQKTRHADAVNGCIVTDSESDDPDTIEKAQSPLDPLLQDVIQKRRGAIKRQMQRLKAKRLEDQCFLRRRINRKVKGIVKDYPDIGQTIEEFVKSCNVGADAWRCTGVLTFDGNRNVIKQKVTYERIRQHLELHYGRHFSYGTVVQLCVARNRRHEEVQYWWCLEHLQMERLATLVTARSSGSSHLNRVELQNGCMTRGHSNLFIPSTLAGSCTESVQVNEEILKQSLELAIEIYIKHVDQSPCGETDICLFRGADASADYHKTRDYLKIFLKGSKKNKENLKREHPQIYQEICDVWDLRQRHLMTGYPSQYIYYLLCCFQPGCIHPLCKRYVGKSRSELSWFPGGPPLTYLPIPIPDPERPWGNNSCKQCSGFCSGHFLTPKEALSAHAVAMTTPPSAMIQQAFKKGKTQGDLSELSQKALLPVDKVKIWVSHLETVDINRKRGAQKAAATRRARSRCELTAESTYLCSACEEAYEEETDEVENWIGCDHCNRWYHWVCVGVVTEPEFFRCNVCTQ